MNKLAIAAIIVIIIIIIVVIVALMQTPALPAGVSEGDNITCEGRGKFYKVQNGKKRWYSFDAYNKAGTPTLKFVTCTVLDSIPTGEDM